MRVAAVVFVVSACAGCAAEFAGVDVVRVDVDGRGGSHVEFARGFVDDDGVAAAVVDDPIDDPIDDPVDVDDAFAAAGLGAAIAADARVVVDTARAAGLVDADAAGREVFSVIDFSLPSTARRLWVFDLVTGEVLENDRVSHGSGSNSDDDPAMAARFSNTPGSLMSSLGLARTAETYEGNNGYSLRLDGLEASNDNLRDRAIVVHGAAYAEDEFVDDNGYLGRSSGCPAVAMSRSAFLIDLIKEGTLLLQWFPDDDWRAASPFVSP